MREITTLVLGTVLACILPQLQTEIVDCGGFITIPEGQTGTISSPNYPNDYPNSTKCIWRIQAPGSHHVQFSIPAAIGETRAGKCRDFIQLRDDSRDGAILNEAICDNSAMTISSTARWLWVMFQSDSNISSSGFQTTFTTLKANANSTIDSVISPVHSCRSHQFACANKECLPYSYRCDGDNDCGCFYDCDEDGCGGTNLSRGERLAIGIPCGFVFFALVFILVTIVDRKHHNMFFKKINDKEESSSRRTSRANSTISSVLAQSINAHRANSMVGPETLK